MKNLFLVTLVAALSACDGLSKQNVKLGAACNTHMDCDGGDCVNGRCVFDEQLVAGALLLDTIVINDATLTLTGYGFNEETVAHILDMTGTMDVTLMVTEVTDNRLVAVLPPELVQLIDASTSTVFSFKLWVANTTAIALKDFVLYRGPQGDNGDDGAGLDVMDSSVITVLDGRYVTRVGGSIETPINVVALPAVYTTVQPADYVPYGMSMWNAGASYLDTKWAYNRKGSFPRCDNGTPDAPQSYGYCLCNPRYGGINYSVGTNCSFADPYSGMMASVRIPDGASPKSLRCRAAYYGSATFAPGDNTGGPEEGELTPTPADQGVYNTGSVDGRPATCATDPCPYTVQPNGATLTVQVLASGRGANVTPCAASPVIFSRVNSNTAANPDGAVIEVPLDSCPAARARVEPNGGEISYQIKAHVTNDWGETFWPYTQRVPFRLYACDVSYSTPSLLP